MANSVFNLSDLNGSNGFAIAGKNANDQSGISVSSAGDINGDGLDDLIIGAFRADPNGSDSGESYVVFGSRSGFSSTLNLSDLNGSNGFAISGKAAGDNSGRSVSSTGDINGDGLDDLIIGADRADPNGFDSGESYVVFGSRSGFSSTLNLSALTGTNGFAIRGKAAFDVSGVSVSSAGDINGDGLDDLIIGAYLADPNGIYSGESYVVFGSRSGFSSSLNLSALNGSNGFAIRGKVADDLSGRSVSSAGDINGDGIDDLIIAASLADPNGSGSGESYVVFGSRSGFSSTLNLSALNGSNGFAIRGKVADDRSGISVSSAGDINGDGIDDLIIGAPLADPNGSGSGESYVVFGSRSGFSSSLELSALNGSNGFAIRGKVAGDRSGVSVSSAGDINGDGIDDLIIGASEADPNGSNSGESYVVFGSRSGFSSTLNLSDLNGSNGFAISGKVAGDGSGSVSSAGDINGDGLDDLIIGAPNADPNGSYSGESYVVYGNAAAILDLNGSNGQVAGFAISGKAAGDLSGISVSSAGDINGDGLDDLLIGANTADPNGSYSGESYVVFGSRSGFSSTLNLSALNGSNGFAISGKAIGDRSGYSVSSAGDINGDGLDDLIIGANGADPNGISNAGESYVVFGSRSGFSSTLNLSALNGPNGFAISGKAASDESGFSVSSAGDINGDGIDDLIIGARGADPNGSASGESYVVFGSRSGFSSSLNLSALNGSNGFAISGKAEDDQSGRSVSSAGDINGDGLDDLIIGAYLADPNGIDRAGESYVVFGSRSGFSSTLNLSALNGPNGFAIRGKAAGDSSGFSVSNAGDINGDGLDDLIIGGSFASPNGIVSSGESYVVFGSRSGFSSTFNLSALNGTNGFAISGKAAGDRSGRSVSSAGDINGDGLDDLIIGAPYADPNGSNSGESYVVFGSRSGFGSTLNLSALNGPNGFAIRGKAAGDQSGFSVSSAGDINGDGFDDLIIGARGADPNSLGNSGESYVVFGAAGIGASGVLELSGLVGSTLDGVNFSTTFTGSSVLVVDTDLTLVDRNSPNLVGATITITNLLNGANESLSATTTATPISSSYNSTTGVLTLSGSATVAQYQQVLRTISYSNTASPIDSTSRVITFVVDDGAASSNTSAIATTTLAIGNIAPVITSAASASFAENGTGIAYTVAATDQNSGTTLTYGLTGLDASLFSVNTSTGAIRFNTAPNFELPADNGGNNVYNINVTASDGSLTSSLAVAITVTDLGEFNGNGTRTDITGTAGNDFIVGGSGAKLLTGGLGNDQFVYNSTRDVGHRITDFTIGEDKIVLTGLLASIGYAGTNPIADGFIQFVANAGVGGGSFLQLDRDGTTGTAIFRNFVQVDIITPAALNNVNNFIF